MIINGKRALAHIQLVHDIQPIEGADNIELVHVIGWTLIAKKGEFQEGDKAVYIEIDSKVPETDERFAFLSSKGYKVKTMKLNKFGVISQGLALQLTSFPELGDAEINTDVTEALHITYAIGSDNYRKDPNAAMTSLKARKPKLFKSPLIKWLMKREWGRKLVLKLFGRKKDKATAFPSQYCSPTDEERVQNLQYDLLRDIKWVVTEKIDGTSSTYILVRHKRLFGYKYEFIVSSRNVRQLIPDQSCYHDENVYWEMAFKYDLEKKMKEIMQQLPDIKYLVIQGETYGAKLQGNKYKMNDRALAVFNLIDDVHGRWPSIAGAEYLSRFDIPWVPIIHEEYELPSTCDQLLQAATGASTINTNELREGWVLRDEDGQRSFKAVSPAFLIKHKE